MFCFYPYSAVRYVVCFARIARFEPATEGWLDNPGLLCCRLFQIVFLVVGLAMFTTVIPEAMMLLGTRKKFGGSYKNERGKTFIVVSNTQTLILYKDRILRTGYVYVTLL